MFLFNLKTYGQTTEELAGKKEKTPVLEGRGVKPAKISNDLSLTTPDKTVLYSPLFTGFMKVGDFMGPDYHQLAITTDSASAPSNLTYYFEANSQYNPASGQIRTDVRKSEYEISLPFDPQMQGRRETLTGIYDGDILPFGENRLVVLGHQFPVNEEEGQYVNHLYLGHIYKEKTLINAGDYKAANEMDGGKFTVSVEYGSDSMPIIKIMDKTSKKETYNSGEDSQLKEGAMLDSGFADKNGVPIKLQINRIQTGASAKFQEVEITLINDTYYLKHGEAPKHNDAVDAQDSNLAVQFSSGTVYDKESGIIRLCGGNSYSLDVGKSTPAPAIFSGEITNIGPEDRMAEPIEITSIRKTLKTANEEVNINALEFSSKAGDLAVVIGGNSSDHKYDKVYYDASDPSNKTYYYPDPNDKNLWIAASVDALATFELKVTNGMVSGKGSLITVSQEQGGNGEIIFTEPTGATPGVDGYVSAHMPFAIGSDNLPSFDKSSLVYKDLKTDEVSYSDGKVITEGTTKVTVDDKGDKHHVSLDVSLDAEKSDVKLKFGTVKLDEYAEAAQTSVLEPAPKKRDGMLAYPNPTSGILTVELPKAPADTDHVEVFDSRGGFVPVDTQIIGRKAVINFGDSPDGVYLIQYTNGDTGKSNEISKVVLQK